MHAVVLFAQLGPYHVARLEAAGKRFAVDGNAVTGIEVTRTGALYAWAPVEGGHAFRKITLFDQRAYEDVTPDQIDTALSAALDTLHPDVMAIPGWSSPEALSALRWALPHGVPAILMSDSARIDAPRRPLGEAIKRRIVSRFSAGLVAGSRHVDYLADLGMPAERVVMGYDTVDNAHFADGADAARADAQARRHALKLPEHYFLSSCRFIAKKNLDGLLVAYARYREQITGTPWDLVLCGDGELRPTLEAQAKGLGLAEHLHFPGFAGYDELPTFYGLAGAFIQASTVEQWGLVVNEAAAAGLPLLVSEPSGCAPELVDPGRNGFLFDPRDSDALAALMGRVAGDRSDRTAMGAASRAIVADWGTARFAEGLHQAATIALRAPPPQLGWIDRLLTQRLMRR